jgi:hypothetical protein
MSSWKLKEEPSSILKNKFLKGLSDDTGGKKAFNPGL